MDPDSAGDVHDSLSESDFFVTSYFCTPPCDGGSNGDGFVDPLDSGFVLDLFDCDMGTGDADCDTADMNGDTLVDPLDVGYVLTRFGTCN